MDLILVVSELTLYPVTPPRSECLPLQASSFKLQVSTSVELLIVALNYMASIPHNTALEIPPAARAALFPRTDLSILDFLQFSLPIVTKSSTKTTASDFFARDPVNCDALQTIQHIPTPPQTIITDLASACEALIRAGHTSIVCAHIPSAAKRRLPLWTVVYWAEVMQIQNDREVWMQAERSLNKRRNIWEKAKRGQTSYPLIEEVYDALAALPWSGSVRGFDQEPLQKLATYAMPKAWFADVHQLQMLELLCQDMMVSNRVRQIELENLDFLKKMTEAHQDHTSETYATSRQFVHLRGVGQALADRERDAVAVMTNVYDCHWVSIVVDFKASRILYGDPKGWAMKDSVIDALDWWTFYHTGREFTHDLLETSRQVDNHNCGLLAFNNLAHFCLPERYPLLEVKHDKLADERLRILLRVVHRHLDQTFQTLGHNFEFTFSSPVLKMFSIKTESNNSLGSDEIESLPVAPQASSSSLDGADRDFVSIPDQEPASSDADGFDLPPDSEMAVTTGSASSDFSSADLEQMDEPEQKKPTAFRRLLQRISPPSSEARSSKSTHSSPSNKKRNLSSLFRTPSPPVVESRISSCSISRVHSSSTDSLPSRITSLHPSTSNKVSRNKETTPSSSPKSGSKASRVASTIHTALKEASDQPKGLLRWFNEKASPKRRREQVARATEESQEFLEEQQASQLDRKQLELRAQREQAKLRQRKSRDAKKEREIVDEKRSPHGTKRRKVERPIFDFHDDRDMHQKLNVAELSRPERRTNERKRVENRKPQGRKRVHEQENATYTNWHSPFLWDQIESAQRALKSWSPSEIRNYLRKKNPQVFGKISRETIRGWIDTRNGPPRWSDTVMRLNNFGNHQAEGNRGGRPGILAAHPDVLEVIVKRLEGLRDAAAPVTLVTTRGVVVATILRMRPEIFEIQYKDGSHFRCSDSFLRRFLHGTLDWSERRATRAGHSLPDNWEELCERAFLQMAWVVKEEDIPTELIVNSDQTQLVYAQGSHLTWTKTGSTQVPVVGEDEKRAFTVVVSVSNSGELLPFQSIYSGKSMQSCPKKMAPHYDDAIKAGFQLEPSKTSTYWSNHGTMHNLVDRIIAPYFTEKKQALALPETQKCLWQIDVWSVHRSEEFCSWMKQNHPTILVQFVPGGCTGVFQACDVGIQRIFKHSCKRSYHEDVVQEILDQIDEGTDNIKVEKTIGVLRDRSVAWLWNAYQTLNKPEVVKKAFAMCRTGEFDLSYESLTGRPARVKLNGLKHSDPEFYAELTKMAYEDSEVTEATGQDLREDVENKDITEALVDVDDSDLPCEVVLAAMMDHEIPMPVKNLADGSLSSNAMAESTEDAPGTSDDVLGHSEAPEIGSQVVQADADSMDVDDAPTGQGLRKKIPNSLYEGFWRH